MTSMTTETHPYSMLIVEDNLEILAFLQEELSLAYPDKLQIKITTSPKQAISLIETNPVHLVITDLHMPQMPGDTLLRKIKEINAGIDVIVLTGNSSFIMPTSCFQDGAAAFIRKPFHLAELTSAIDISLQKLDHWSELLGDHLLKVA